MEKIRSGGPEARSVRHLDQSKGTQKEPAHYDALRHLATIAGGQREPREPLAASFSSEGTQEGTHPQKQDPLDRWRLSAAGKDLPVQKDGSLTSLFDAANDLLNEPVTPPQKHPAMERYREQRKQALDSIQDIAWEDFQEECLLTKMERLQEEREESGTDELNAQVAAVERWRDSNMETTEHMVTAVQHGEQHQEQIKSLMQSLQSIKKAHPERASEIEDQLARLHRHHSELDPVIRMHHIFIRTLRYELDGLLYPVHTAFLSPHQCQETEDKGTLENVFEHPGAGDCAPHAIAQIMSLYHPMTSINAVYEKVYRDHRKAKEVGASLMIDQEAYSLSTSLPILDQYGDRIRYLPATVLSLADLENALKMKDNKGGYVPVILTIISPVLLQDSYDESAGYMAHERKSHAVAVRLRSDQAYDVWTPSNRIIVKRLKHLYDLTFVRPGTNNGMVIPVYPWEYRLAMSRPVDGGRGYIHGDMLRPRDLTPAQTEAERQKREAAHNNYDRQHVGRLYLLKQFDGSERPYVITNGLHDHHDIRLASANRPATAQEVAHYRQELADKERDAMVQQDVALQRALQEQQEALRARYGE